MVSRVHCELYAVMYDPTITHVYIRDRKSVNGTYVNGVLVGAGPSLSPSYLLQDGDVIMIKPFWKFVFQQPRDEFMNGPTAIQIQERNVRGASKAPTLPLLTIGLVVC